MRTKIIAVVLILAVAVVASIAFAQGPMAGNKARPGQGMGMGMQAGGAQGGCGLGLCFGVGPAAMRDLNLTQDQITQLQQLKERQMAATANTRQQLQDAQAALKDLLVSENPSKDAVKRQLANIAAIQTELRNTCVDFMFASRDVLTAAQREQLRTALQNAPGPMGMGMGCGMMGSGMGMGANCPMGKGKGMGPGAGNGTGTCPTGGMGRNGGVCPRTGQ